MRSEVLSWQLYEQKIAKSTSSNLDQFILTVDYISGYQAFAMILTLADIINFFITQQFQQITDPSEISTKILVFYSSILCFLQCLDLVVVASFGFINKVKWFNIPYLLYSLSFVSYLVVFAVYHFTNHPYHYVMQFRLGFLSIFRGYVRAISKKKNNYLINGILSRHKAHNTILNIVFIIKAIQVIFKAIYGIITFIMVCVGVIFLQDTQYVQNNTFLDALYFIVVTMSTVGYGDITLQGQTGRLVTVVIILVALGYIPYALTQTVSKIKYEIPKLILQRSIFGGVVLIGSKNMELFKCLRIILPTTQSLQFLIQTDDENVENHQDVDIFSKNTQKVNYILNGQFHKKTLQRLSINQALMVVIYSTGVDNTFEEDGQAIYNAIQAAQSLDITNSMLVFLQHDNSIKICQEALKQFLEPFQFHIYSVSQTISKVIAVSSQHRGFSTFFYNMLLPHKCQLNKYPLNKTELIKNKMIEFGLFSVKSKQLDQSELWQHYNHGLGPQNDIKEFIMSYSQQIEQTERSSGLLSITSYFGTKQKILLVAIGNINQRLFEQTFQCLITEDVDLMFLSFKSNVTECNGAKTYYGDIFDTQTYINAKASILIFMDDNNGREVLLQHVLKQANVNYTFCCQESLLEIQDKLSLYQSQYYLPFGMSALMSIVMKSPIFFAKSIYFLQNIKCTQYEIEKYKTIEIWEQIHQQEFILYIIRDSCVINRYDKQFDLCVGDIITAARKE